MVKTENLKARGWTPQEIEKYKKTIAKHEHYYGSTKTFHRLIYWFSLLILTVCNLLVAVFLVPFILVLQGAFVYIIIGVLGLIFGLLFNHVIQNIEHLELRHHVFAAIFIPLIAVINIFVMVTAANRISEILQLTIELNPLMLSSVYVSLFLIPYVISLLGTSKKW